MGNEKIIDNPKDIMLGRGVFLIDGKAIGATQGGGKFTLAREFRTTAIDGAPGTIKGMTEIEGATPTLEISHLEIINDDIKKRHPGLKATVTGEKTVITGTRKISDEDYHEVCFVGRTKGGREVVITVKDAINLENVEFDFKEKSEVIDKCTFTGTYPADFEEGYEPWEITYPKGDINDA